MEKQRAPRNRTLTCSAAELNRLSEKLSQLMAPTASIDLEGRVINQDLFKAAPYLPKSFADLIVLDPPYNLSKNFHGHIFKGKERAEYCAYFESILDILLPTLKPNGTVYVCSDWKTSVLVAPILEERLYVRNRITWEREKGRLMRTAR